ncbi:uncharacterized protein G2W53_015009 [Senna tora]|uniref:Uncharacterized protein n=1 Tax=Senna tora TaxID=362788 RepID=A0A835C3I9_9FABA|nr:uncharacterized protein G2W53_015009 [Senna tora]
MSPSKEDPWPPDRSLGVVISLHQISRRRPLVAADLAGENAEVLRIFHRFLSCAASVDVVDEKD